MKAIAAVMSIIAVVVSAGSPQAARGEEWINRREQARLVFLATPQGLYQHYCAHCHGEDGRGSGRLWASELPARPADLTALGRDKEYVAALIRDGSAAQGRSNLCPPWGRTLSPANLERLAQYIFSLGHQTSQPASAPGASVVEPPRQPFPWLLLAVVLAEMALLWRVVRRRKEVSDVVP